MGNWTLNFEVDSKFMVVELFHKLGKTRAHCFLK